MMPFASRLAVIAAACGLVLLAASPFVGLAQAFTIEDQSGVTKDDASRNAIADPNGRVSRFGSGNSQTTVKQGNTTLQFGVQPSFNQRYDSNRLFDPGSRLNDGR